MNKYGYIKDLLVEKKYISFVHEITSGYNRKIPYHNDMHATDVLQTVHILIDKGNLVNVNKRKHKHKHKYCKYYLLVT